MPRLDLTEQQMRTTSPPFNKDVPHMQPTEPGQTGRRRYLAVPLLGRVPMHLAPCGRSPADLV